MRGSYCTLCLYATKVKKLVQRQSENKKNI